MMVGPSGSGKSSAWRTLLKALENLEGVEGVAHVVDPKVLKVVLPIIINLPAFYHKYCSLNGYTTHYLFCDRS